MDRDIRIERLEGAYAEQKAIIKALLEYSELELTSTIYGHVIKNKDGQVIQEILWKEVKKTMDERKKSIENASPKKCIYHLFSGD